MLEIISAHSPKVHRIPMVSSSGRLMRIISQSSIIRFLRMVRRVRWSMFLVGACDAETLDKGGQHHRMLAKAGVACGGMLHVTAVVVLCAICVVQHTDKFAPLLSHAIRAGRPVITVSEEDTVIQVFNVMVSNNLTAVPILDSDGKFITPISISDIRIILLTKDVPLRCTPTRLLTVLVQRFHWC